MAQGKFQIDEKFAFDTTIRNIVNVRNDNEIPVDEPRFLLVGRDIAMLGTLEAYYNECVNAGSPEAHLSGIRDKIKQVRDWQRANKDKVDAPD